SFGLVSQVRAETGAAAVTTRASKSTVRVGSAWTWAASSAASSANAAGLASAAAMATNRQEERIAGQYRYDMAELHGSKAVGMRAAFACALGRGQPWSGGPREPSPEGCSHGSRGASAAASAAGAGGNTATVNST